MRKLRVGLFAALLVILFVGSAQPVFAHTVDDDGSGGCPTGHALKEIKIVGSDGDDNANGLICVDAKKTPGPPAGVPPDNPGPPAGVPPLHPLPPDDAPGYGGQVPGGDTPGNGTDVVMGP